MTRGVTVAIVGAPDIAKELGKKGTASDLTLYNTVHDDAAITLVEPTQFPEKFPPLLTALAMADHCLLVVPELSRPVAETIATVELHDLPTTVVLGASVGDAEVGRAFKGSRLATVPRVPLDFPRLRDLVDGLESRTADGPVRVPIDHAFPVKGVGAVALGVVRRGVLRAHERLRLYPTPKTVEVRSLQVHDIDRKEANAGERVGVALKGVEADEISRGQTLGPDGSLVDGATVAFGPLERCRYYRGDLVEGAHLHLAVGLQVVPVVVTRADAGGSALETDRPIAFAAGARALLLDLSAPVGPRIAGRTVIAGTA